MRSQLPRGFVRFYDNGGSKLLRLPQEIAKIVKVEQIFKIETTDDGILLRPVNGVQQTLPSWASSPSSTEEADSSE